MPDLDEELTAIRESLQAITPDTDRYELRGRLADIRNWATRAVVRIDAEVIDELRRGGPMPEHGFSGSAAEAPRQPTPTKREYTVDDLLS
jgi:hypothetical protein